MICETISCSMFKLIQCKNVLQEVQLLWTVHIKWKETQHQLRETYEKTL